jgi:hypothetical protein
MRRNLLIILALVVVVLLVVAAPVGAEKPTPTLEGEMDPLDLVVPPPDSPPPLCTEDLRDEEPKLCLCGEGTEFRGLYAWEGTITFPEEAYTIVFINLGTARENPSGVASPFDEIWAIYEGEVVTEDDWCPSTDHATIWGYDSGVSNLNNFTYRMNGHVEAATGDFEGWEGRSVHMSGTFSFADAPTLHAPGELRLN